MPLQLLNLGVIIPRVFYRLLVTRTPRGNFIIIPYFSCLSFPTDFAELNAPPVINYGTVYPQAILIFVITLLYSIAQPLILIFGAIYFGAAYLVYKYKLLFGERMSAQTNVIFTMLQYSTSHTSPKGKLGLSPSHALFGASSSSSSSCQGILF